MTGKNKLVLTYTEGGNMQDGEDCGGINLVAKVKILEKKNIDRKPSAKMNTRNIRN